MTLKRLLILEFNLIAFCMVSFSQFSEPNLISTSIAGINGLEIKDIDNNGTLDIITAGFAIDQVSWFEFDGTNDLAPQQWINANYNSPHFLQVADFDGDSLLDVAYGSELLGEIVWQKNLGGGVFGPPVQIYTFSSSFLSLVASDIDGDNDVDLAYSIKSGAVDRIGMLENNGVGTFTDQLIDITGGWPKNLQFHDMDLDNDLDMLVSFLSLNPLLNWYEAASPGDFSNNILNMIIPDISNLQVIDHAVGDIDGDMDLDVVASLYDGDDNYIWLYENIGAGIFIAPQFLLTASVNSYPFWDVIMEDLDGDLDLDIIAALTDLDQVVWWQNQGQGVFSDSLVLFDQIDNPGLIQMKDLDNDLDLDIAITSSTINGLYWAESNININTGISKEEEELFSVHPNPVSNILNIQLNNEQQGEFQLEIYNGTGELIQRETNISTQHFSIELGEHPSGIYMVRMTNRKQTSYTKTVVLAR